MRKTPGALPSLFMPTAAFSAPPAGTLIAWGGGDDNPMLDWLATYCATLPEGRCGVEIVVAATPVRPLVTGRNYAAALMRRGFSSVNVMQFTARIRPDNLPILRRLAAAQLVFFTGGDQERLTDVLLGTQFHQLLLERYRTDGLIVAGTSAGAAALGERMIVAGHGWRALLSGRVRTEPGLGLVPKVFIDTHFAERGRFGRLAHAVLREPRMLGVGVAEETGVVWQAGAPELRIIGDEVVTVMDGRRSKAPGLAAIPYNEPISGRDVRMHLLAAGERFDR
jgi:cyanophycinase